MGIVVAGLMVEAELDPVKALFGQVGLHALIDASSHHDGTETLDQASVVLRARSSDQSAARSMVTMMVVMVRTLAGLDRWPMPSKAI